MAITLRTANQVCFKLPLKIVGTPKPAFEFVIVVTAKVINDHVRVLVIRQVPRDAEPHYFSLKLPVASPVKVQVLIDL